jgi:hypothetical protein
MIVIRTIAITAVLLALAPSPASACSLCAGSFRSKQTLRMHFASAKVVLYGQLKNPRFDPATDKGTTDFSIRGILKDNPARANRVALTLPQYLPVIGDTPPDCLLFCGVVDGVLDPTHIFTAPAAVVEYVKAAVTCDDTDPAKKLGFFFKYLDAADPRIAEDAFLEFARASDSEILKAAGQLDPVKVRKLLTDPTTPIDRLGVFALLLGMSGTPDDAAFLAKMVKESPLSDRASAAFGGLLAGYILLTPKDGWAFTAAIVADEKRGYAERLSAIGTIRFFQATRPIACKPEVLACYAALLPHGDLADQAIEDLQRWGYWDLTTEVLAQYGKPTHAAPLVRRSILRYALTCPNDSARQFVATVRQSDPKLVQDVETMLAQFAPALQKPNPK